MPLPREPNAEPIPGYRLIERLGVGGFGEVWKCEAPGGLVKAIKYVFGNLEALDSEGVRAEQELNALQRIKTIRHPFILSIERVEIIGGELLIVMEIADKSLHDRFLECQADKKPGIPRDELLSNLRDAAEALDLMNVQHDLQHLDIKPRNLFLVSNRVKVADFGLVKDLEAISAGSQTSSLMGGITPLYAAPETFQGIISRHSDQYSLAIVYYELLTGSRPFHGKTPRQLMMQHMKEEPDLHLLPEAERPIVAKALSKNPRQRFASCMAFVRAIASGKIPDEIPVTPPRGAERPAPRPVSMGESMEDMFLSPLDSGHLFQTPPKPKPIEAAPDEMQMSLTVAQPLTGSLKPTLVIGAGDFGRRVLQALRCRFVDRFGNLNKLPLLRFLYLDTNQDGLNQAMQGSPEEALSPSETYHLPFQAVMQYRRNRQALEKLKDWLPLEKLYAMSRSLETNGSRALGRLALTENYLRLAGRLKRELQTISDADNIFHAVSQSGLALRSDTPQVYLIAAAGGGTGGSILVDVGYTLRRLLQDMGHGSQETLCVLMCGAPDDPATPADEQANVYAALTEINHFSDPAVTFTAQYGMNGPTLNDQGPPFQSTYLATMPHRGPVELKEAAARIASYVFQDLSTPIGIRTSQARHAQSVAAHTPFRSFGVYTIWYPRGLLIRLAARRACQMVLARWRQMGDDVKVAVSAADLDSVFQEACWKPELIRQHVEQGTVTAADGTFGQALTGFLATLESGVDQAVARDDPAGWCRLALERVREWLGSGNSTLEETSEWRKSRMHRTLSASVAKLVEEYYPRLATPAKQPFDQPGYRLAAVDAIANHYLARCHERLLGQDSAVRDHARKTENALQQVDLSIQACITGGGFSLFGNRTRKLLRTFLDKLTVYARCRLAEEYARSVQHFYASLEAKLGDLRRDLVLCQQRLRHLEDAALTLGRSPADGVGSAFDLAASSSTAPAHLSGELSLSLAARIVLPEGVPDLHEAAARFLAGLKPADWDELDAFLQTSVLTPVGGLYQVCMNAGDPTQTLGVPLLDGAAEHLAKLIPSTDVCDAEISSVKTQQLDWVEQAKEYFALAAPFIGSDRADREQGFFLVPGSPAGKVLAEQAKRALPAVSVIRTLSPTDFAFCRELADVGPTELKPLLQSCKATYQRAAANPPSSPHCRCDIGDWVPLDP